MGCGKKTSKPEAKAKPPSTSPVQEANNNQPKTDPKPKPTVEAPKVVVAEDQLEERDDLWYFEGKPFTGVTVEKYPNGQKRMEGTLKDGKHHGLQSWYENGQKEREYTFKDYKLDGLYTRWYRNGQKNWERTHKDGELISEKEWDEDGNLTREYPKPPKP